MGSNNQSTDLYKKIYIGLVSCLIVFCSTSYFGFAQLETTTANSHYTTLNQDICNTVEGGDFTDENGCIGEDGQGIKRSQSSLRQGTHNPIQFDDQNTFIEGTASEPQLADGNDDSTNYNKLALETIKYVKNIINYVLGFLGLVALVFLIYAGFKVLTSTEEEGHQEGTKKLKLAFIAIGGIGLARFVVSAIYYVVRVVRNGM